MSDLTPSKVTEFRNGAMAAKNGEPFNPQQSPQWIDGYQWITLLQLANTPRPAAR